MVGVFILISMIQRVDVLANAWAEVNFDTKLLSCMTCVLRVSAIVHGTCATMSIQVLRVLAISIVFLHAPLAYNHQLPSYRYAVSTPHR